MKRDAVNWLRRHGRYLPHSRRSIWLHGPDIASFSAAEALITKIRRRWPQYRIVHTAPDRMTVNWISSRLRDDAVLPLPINRRAMMRFLNTLSPHVLILLNHAPIRPDLLSIITTRLKTIISDLNHSDWLFTCLAAENIPDPLSVRKELGIGIETRVIAISHPTTDEISALSRAHCELNKKHSNLTLLIETSHASNAEKIFKRDGLTVSCRSECRHKKRTDVLIMDMPAEFPGMASIASAVIIGGTFSRNKPVTSPVWFAAMNIPVITGPLLDEHDPVLRRFIEAGALLSTNLTSLPSLLDGILSGETDTHAQRQKACRIVQNAGTTAASIMQFLEPLIPAPPPESAHQQGWRIKTRLDRIAETRAGSWMAKMRSGKCLADWGQLKRRLGHPKHILCLGNGPSSEDPQLSSIPHDALFRVNWRWMQRDFLTNPDVVFVGDPKTVHHISTPIMAFGTRHWEQTMLLRHLLAGRISAPEFFTLERMPGMLNRNNWWARPSNGAIMIASAVALAPDQITIAGIDLFQHPDGRYPGDVRSTNDYAQVHHRNVDMEVIQAALKEYKGEVTVIGSILRDAIKAQA